MENRDLSNAINLVNSITGALVVSTLVFILGFGNKFGRWQEYRDLRDETECLQRAGVKPSAAMDLVYREVYSCYHDTVGLSGSEPARFCADAAASIALSQAKQEDRLDGQKLLASMKSDLRGRL